MALFTLPQMISRLTKGFVKVTGRMPDGLEKIKIKQEALEKIKQQNKVLDMEGNVIDTSKGIMGGKQVGMFDNIFNRMQKDMGRGDPKIVKSKKPDPEEKAMGGRAGFSNGGIDILKAEDKAFQNAIDAFKYYQKMGGKKNFKDYLKEAGRFGDQFRADGGRAGFSKGKLVDLARRKFLKATAGVGAGIGALKTGLLGLGKEAAPAVEAVKETVTQAPSYFFDLVAKIKLLGTQRRTPSYRERVDEYQYTGKDGNEYLLTEELDTGDIIIQKDKLGGTNYGDESYEVIEDRTEMVFRKGQGDETTQGTPADDYEEYKVEFDQDGTAADVTDIDELSKKEIIKEVTEDAPPIKKAGGGIARMLGE